MARRRSYSDRPVVVNVNSGGGGCLKWLFIIFVLIPILGLLLTYSLGKYGAGKLPDIELADPDNPDRQEAPDDPEDR